MCLPAFALNALVSQIPLRPLVLRTQYDYTGRVITQWQTQNTSGIGGQNDKTPRLKDDTDP